MWPRKGVSSELCIKRRVLNSFSKPEERANRSISCTCVRIVLPERISEKVNREEIKARKAILGRSLNREIREVQRVETVVDDRRVRSRDISSIEY
jgi:hypothetical protein